MAGAGKKTFQVNEVLSAADVNNYLMDQSVMRFPDDTARSSAIGTPSEGMVSYLDDSNQVEVYDGSSWVNFTGDITQVTAGTGLSGGGTEGNVTLNAVDATPTSVGVVKGSTVDGNTSIGEDALLNVDTGTNNTAMGILALLENDSGSSNSGFGREALRENTTGAENNAVGMSALRLNTAGSRNNAFGNGALRDSVSITDNCAFGNDALLNNEGDGNCAFGSSSLTNNTSGNFNVSVGRLSNTLTTEGSNVITIGNNSQPSSATVDNEISLGNGSITALRCNVQSISSLSDERDKTNIQDSPLGLDLIQRLRPVTFDWDRRDGSFAGRKDVGFIAQDVVEVEDELDIEDTLRMSYRSNPEKLEVAQARLIPVLTKAIQELSEQNAELKARLDKLEGK